MRFNLAQLARQSGLRRRGNIRIRNTAPPKTFADELARIELRLVAGWTERLPAINAGYERALQTITNDSPSSLADDLTSIGQDLSRLVLSLTPSMRDWALRVERWHREKWVAAVLTPTTVDLSSILHVADVVQTVETVVARNVALIRDVSSQLQGRIADAVFRGLQRRTPPREVARTIREATGMARQRAIRIASDQSTKLTSALDRERQQQAGLDSFEWLWSQKLHGREEHIERDGTVYTWEDAPEDLPGDLPFCGCRAGAVMSLED